MSRRFLTSEQLLRKCSEIEILGGYLDNEAIRLNYDDPFLSNEAKNSFVEKERKPKSDKMIRPSESMHDPFVSASSIRSELDEVKQILKAMNSRRGQQPSANGFDRNFRQTPPQRNDFFTRSRFPRNNTNVRFSQPDSSDQERYRNTQRKFDWQQNSARPNFGRQGYGAQRSFTEHSATNGESSQNNFRPMPSISNNPAIFSSGNQPVNPFRKASPKKESINAEGLSDLTKSNTN